MKVYLREDLKELKPYIANTVQYPIMLDANESPYDLPLDISSSLADQLINGMGLNRYPDSDANILRNEIAALYQLKTDQVMVGTGSDELIQIIINAFVDKGEAVLCPTPSFGMYKILTQLAGGRAVEVPLDKNYEYDPEEIIKACRVYKPKVIFICTPNNPTGNIIADEDIIHIIKNAPGVVVIDEAYCEFSGRSFVGRVSEFPNVVILRTFSKAMGLAGLRVGYSLSCAELAAQLYKVKPPYNLNSFSQMAAVLVLKNMDIIRERIACIVAQRDKLINKLRGLEHIQVYPSQANFILLKVVDAEKTFEKLRSRGILVRNFSSHPMLKNCLRVTVGLEEENRAFFETLKSVIKGEE